MDSSLLSFVNLHVHELRIGLLLGVVGLWFKDVRSTLLTGHTGGVVVFERKDDRIVMVIFQVVDLKDGSFILYVLVKFDLDTLILNELVLRLAHN